MRSKTQKSSEEQVLCHCISETTSATALKFDRAVPCGHRARFSLVLRLLLLKWSQNEEFSVFYGLFPDQR